MPPRKKKPDPRDRATAAQQMAYRIDPKTQGTYTGAVIGFKIPFALQYLFDSGVCPFGVTVTFNALQMSCKSMLTFEFGRFVQPYYGWHDYIVGEGKWSESLAYAVAGHSPKQKESIRPKICESLTAMMEQTTASVEKLEDVATKGGAKALGWHNGVVVTMDSIGGANTEMRNKNIEKTGSAQREFSSEALDLTNYLKWVSNRIESMPLILLLIRHRKEDPGATQYEKNVRKSGGKHVGFQATYDIGLASSGHRREFDNSAQGSLVRESRLIRMDCEKNSLGSADRRIHVRVSWKDVIWMNPEGNPEVLRVAKWHWEEAIVTILENWLLNKEGYGDRGTGKKSVAGRAAKFNQWFHLDVVTGRGGKRYWSKTLGMSESDATTPVKLGKYIEQNEDAKRLLRHAFGIKEGIEWNPENDYKAFRKKKLAEAKKAAEASYRTSDDERLRELLDDDCDQDDFAEIGGDSD